MSTIIMNLSNFICVDEKAQPVIAWITCDGKHHEVPLMFGNKKTELLNALNDAEAEKNAARDRLCYHNHHAEWELAIAERRYINQLENKIGSIEFSLNKLVG